MGKAIIRLRGLIWLLRQHMKPAHLIAGSFFCAILFGTVLLCLPLSQNPDADVGFTNALFTSASAVCLTGLATLNTAQTWSIFGKIVILALIQLGGLSFVTVYTFFLVAAGKKITLKNRLAVQASLNSSGLQGMVRMVKFIVRGTFICEGAGAVILFIFFLTRGYPILTSAGWGIFHSVSAFCNSGFDLAGEQGFIPFSGNVIFCFVIMSQIFLGGLGFTVWRDILQKLRYLTERLRGRRTRPVCLSVHSRLVLIVSLILIASGGLYILLAEYSNPLSLEPYSMPEKILRSFFQSVSLRTAGFSAFAQEGIKASTKLFSALLMIIGGSPGGTAGGMKTISIAVVVCSVFSTLRGYNSITVFRRRLPAATLGHALTLIISMLFLCMIAAGLLSFTEFNGNYSVEISDILYEVTSAFGAGLTTGVTPNLTTAGKYILTICMYIGRIGPITLLVTFAGMSGRVSSQIKYQEADVVIG